MEKKRLTKSSKDKKFFGVCGGFAEYFDCNSTIVRLIFVASTLLFGFGPLFYLIAALVMPNDED